MAGIFALKDAMNSAEPYVFDLSGEPVGTNERLDVRPAVIVSRSDFDGSTEPVICVPLTTRSHGSCYEVAIGQQPFLEQELWAYVRGLAAFERKRLTQLLGRVTLEQLGAIRGALRYSMEL
jgi:mRNA-degrading endonuclease toxin of MazEF toxin-antitoxin module